MLVLEATVQEEIKDGLRLLLRDNCGLAGAFNIDNAARHVRDMLILQEPRGDITTGIVSGKDEELYDRIRVGRARDEFREVNWDEDLPGRRAIGHGLYATVGGVRKLKNGQPFVFDSRYGPFAVAHNGEFINATKRRKQLLNAGALFRSSSDTEVFAHEMARSRRKTIEDAIKDATKKLPAAYSLLIMTPDKLIAMRDKFGIRPLSIAQLDDGHLIASETYALDQYPKAKLAGDLGAGEMAIFEKGKLGFTIDQYVDADEHFCIFEGVYFANPRTRYNGVYHEDFRYECGIELYKENPWLKADIIVPVLDSGKQATMGLAKAMGLEYQEPFLRIHNPPGAADRSFTAPTMEEQVDAAYKKLHLRPDKVKGKRVLVVDDSIVRSTTMKIIIERLRDAGALEITVAIAAPPIINMCPYGIDFHDMKRLVARHYESEEEIAKHIGADKLVYLSPKGVDNVNKRTYKIGICSGCYSGEYPITPTGVQIITPDQVGRI